MYAVGTTYFSASLVAGTPLARAAQIWSFIFAASAEDRQSLSDPLVAGSFPARVIIFFVVTMMLFSRATVSYTHLDVYKRQLSIYAVNEGYIDDVPVGKILAFEEALHAHFVNTQGALVDTINKTGNWNDEIEATFKQGISEFKTTGSW